MYVFNARVMGESYTYTHTHTRSKDTESDTDALTLSSPKPAISDKYDRIANCLPLSNCSLQTLTYVLN